MLAGMAGRGAGGMGQWRNSFSPWPAESPTFSTTDPGMFKRAIDMTDDELAAIVGRAKLTLVKSDT